MRAQCITGNEDVAFHSLIWQQNNNTYQSELLKTSQKECLNRKQQQQQVAWIPEWACTQEEKQHWFMSIATGTGTKPGPNPAFGTDFNFLSSYKMEVN